jgi:hypothetical protein
MLFRVSGLLVNTAHFKNNSQKIIGAAPQAGVKSYRIIRYGGISRARASRARASRACAVA